ncbi:phosphoribosylanthranilate isomerase [Candidatus Binatia bacterium]|nr:phosphoribosylanthranilate isomerase [Candidatus Binatia bacterium]
MGERVRVKICGITNVADALAAAGAGADALGFNFYTGSVRYVSPDAAAAIAAQLPKAVCTVGVFVNAARAEIERIAAQVGLQALQFHGDEEPPECAGWSRKTIKALRVRDRGAAALAQRYAVDFVLADAYVAGRHGGTGASVPPELIEGFDRRRLILAGGLTPENVRAAVRAVQPFAVDVASGVESAPGKKDHEKMRRFIDHVQSA